MSVHSLHHTGSQGRIQVGGHGAHASPFGTEQTRNAEVYRTLSARRYSDPAYISKWITASCPKNIKRSDLQLLTASNTKANSKEGAPSKWPIAWATLSCHKLCVVIMVSDSLRSTLTQSRFQTFPGGKCTQIPLEDCALCSIYARTAGLHSSVTVLTANTTRIIEICSPRNLFSMVRVA